MAQALPSDDRSYQFRSLAEWIYRRAHYFQLRTGELLFYDLLRDAAEVVRGTDLDPFFKEMDVYELQQYMEAHCIFDDLNNLIVFYAMGDILWEKT